MAEGLAHDMGWAAYSAGTKPELEVNPFAKKVMIEIGIDISKHLPQSVNEYLDENFNIIATVCDNAREKCPLFTGSSDHQIHHGFEDPADARGSDGEITEVYRRIRDEIQDWITKLSEATENINNLKKYFTEDGYGHEKTKKLLND